MHQLLCWSENIKYFNAIEKYLNTYASVWYLNTIQILNFVEYLAKYFNTKHMVFVTTLRVIRTLLRKFLFSVLAAVSG